MRHEAPDRPDVGRQLLHRARRASATASLLAALVSALAAETWSLLHFGATEEWAAYRFELLLIGPALLGLAAFSLSPVPARRSERAAVLVGLLLTAAVVVLPTLRSRGFAHLWIGWVGVFLGMQAVRRGRSVAAGLMAALVVVGTVEAVYGLGQAFGWFLTVRGRPLGGAEYASGTLVNPNHFAGLVNLTVLLSAGAWGVVVERLRHRRRVAALLVGLVPLLLLAVAAVAVVATRSRGGVLGLAAGLLVALVLLVRDAGRKARARVLMAGVALLLVAGGMVAWAVRERADLLESFQNLDGAVERLTIYGDSLRLIGDHALLGVGPGMWQWHFRRYQSVTGLSYYEHAHNDYLETASEWGLPLALLIWGALLVALLRAGARFEACREAWKRAVLLGGLAALATILAHGLLDFSLQIPANLLCFGLVLGLVLATRADEPVASARLGAASRLLGHGLVIALALLLAGAAARLPRRERAASAAREATSLAALEEATEADPQQPEAQLYAGLALRDGLERRDLAASRRHLTRAVELNPWNWRYRLELGRLDELEGRLAEAESQLSEAVRLNPVSGEYRWRLANLRLRRGDTDAAVVGLGRAVARDYRLTNPAVSLARKIGVSWNDLERAWADDPRAVLGLLSSICSGRTEGEPDPATVERIATDVIERVESLGSREGARISECLAERSLVSASRRTTVVVASRLGQRDESFARRGNLVWNGDVELPVTRRGIGWRAASRKGLRVRRADGVGGDAGHALEIVLTGYDHDIELQRIALPAGVGELALSARVRVRASRQPLTLELTGAEGRTVLRADLGEPAPVWRDLDLRAALATAGELARLRLRPSDGMPPSGLVGRIELDDVRLVFATEAERTLVVGAQPP